MVDSLPALKIQEGKSRPYGVTHRDQGVNFALFAKHATIVTLCLFDDQTRSLVHEIPLHPVQNRTGDIWHIFIEELPSNLLYGYRIDGPHLSSLRFVYDSNNVLLDPYAREVATGNVWKSRSVGYHPLGRVGLPHAFDWQGIKPPRLPLRDLVIYEMHVRAFTCHASSTVQHPGTYLGVIEKIPYLLDLGINAVEFMPLFEFDENEVKLIDPFTQQRLINFWGYSTVNYFAPMNRFASSPTPGAALTEFKTMVRELHRHGIEVILDVVYNHTAEGNEEGPILSYKGIDNPVYYIMDEQDNYANYSGCGNTFNCNHITAAELILESLRYWVAETQVDGFRFDLASCLTRGKKGQPLNPAPLVEAISDDPLLADIKLIAEPWDAVGLYQVGSFYPEQNRWSEWNGIYRDTVRRYIKGTPGIKGMFITRLCGSEDLYYNRSPLASVNFISAHDGFSLYDLVAYNHKHNQANGEHNRDGSNDNDSWNCGEEGPSADPLINVRRQQQMRNFVVVLMVSAGIPMMWMGDEYGHTKQGNNNTWCQDNELNWFLWDQLGNHSGLYRFFKLMIAFRKANPLLKRGYFLKPNQARWHGIEPHKPDWGQQNQLVAFSFLDNAGQEDIYIALNAQSDPLDIILPRHPDGKRWHLIVNTAAPSPEDIFEVSQAPEILELKHRLSGYSALLLKAL